MYKTLSTTYGNNKKTLKEIMTAILPLLVKDNHEKSGFENLYQEDALINSMRVFTMQKQKLIKAKLIKIFSIDSVPIYFNFIIFFKI